MLSLRSVLITTLLASTMACATVRMKPEGEQVKVVPAAPSSACESLGTVFGQGGGMMTLAAYVSNERLAESALNDARNKAGGKGATHIVPGQTQINGAGSSASLTAFAFRCP